MNAPAGACKPAPFLLASFVLYTLASLTHFVHNAEFIHDYPNLPAWLLRSHVYLAWLAVFAVGVAGYATLKFGYRRAGLLVLAAYAGLGFAGLDHYALAPVSAHSIVMNFTIIFEVVAALLLLLVVMFASLRGVHGSGIRIRVAPETGDARADAPPAPATQTSRED